LWLQLRRTCSFSVIGLSLVGFGAFGDRAIQQGSLGLNLNLAWGVVLLVLEAIMLTLEGER
jgi:hypothetical protein